MLATNSSQIAFDSVVALFGSVSEKPTTYVASPGMIGPTTARPAMSAAFALCFLAASVKTSVALAIETSRLAAVLYCATASEVIGGDCVSWMTAWNAQFAVKRLFAAPL